jgi:hypothetical protein
MIVRGGRGDIGHEKMRREGGGNGVYDRKENAKHYNLVQHERWVGMNR